VDSLRLLSFGVPDASILFQLLFLAALTTFWNPVNESNFTRYILLCNFFMLAVSCIVSLFLLKLNATRENCIIRASAFRMIVVENKRMK